MLWSAAVAGGGDVLAGLEHVYPDVAQLRDSKSPVVCFVDTQHPDIVRQDLGKPGGHTYDVNRLKAKIELEVAGLPCLVVHYVQLGQSDLERDNVKAMVIGSRRKRVSRELDEKLFSILRRIEIPVLGLCGGHNLIAAAYGGTTGPMRRLEPGEDDPNPRYYPGRLKEWGPTQVELLEGDPLFEGLQSPISVRSYHGWEIKTLPQCFENLATNDCCKIQIIGHKTKPIYGLQFQAQLYSDRYPAGETLLRNFFRLTGIDVAKRTAEALRAFRANVVDGIDQLFDSSAKLRSRSSPFVCFIDTEHPDEIRRTMESASGGRHSDKIKRWRERIELDVAGLPCLVAHYTQVLRRDFDNPSLRAIMISGRAHHILPVMDRELFRLIRGTGVPTIGFCGGHQLIAQAYGARVAAMRRLKPGEEDPAPHRGPGFFKEWGFRPVRIVRSDSLLGGLGDSLLVREMHFAEVKELPAELELLASTDECRVQAMKHRGRLLYGTQFHPEGYDDEHPDGRSLLRNFFRLAGIDVDREIAHARKEFLASILEGLEPHYQDAHKLAHRSSPAIVILDIQRPSLIRKRAARHFRSLAALRTKLTELAGLPCLLIHYTQVTKESFDRAPVRAMVVTTRSSRINEVCERELFRLIRETSVPTLGISGGHQAVAAAYGSKITRMRKLRPGERDPNPKYHPGRLKECGFVQIGITASDPLFAGFQREATVHAYHAYEVSELANVFDVLASTKACRVQAIKHRDKPLYAVQFDPSRYDAEHLDGRRILENFLRMACR